MRWLLVTPLLSGALLLGAIMAFNAGYFHAGEQAWLSRHLHAQVKLGPTQVVLGFPPRVRVGTSEIVAPEIFSVRWQRAEFSLLRMLPPGGLRVALDAPVVKWEGEWLSPSAGGRQSSAIAPMALALDVRQGEWTSARGHLSHLDLHFEQKQLGHSVAHVQLSASVAAAGLPIPVPVALESDSLTLSPEAIKATEMKLTVAGLEVRAQGGSLLKEGRHRWKATLEAPDLRKLARPPVELPAQNWRGALHVSLEAVKDAPDKPWTAEGDIRANGLAADFNWKRDNSRLEGPVSLTFEGHFSGSSLQPVISKLQGTLDLSSAQVSWGDWLSKAAGVPMRAVIAASGDENQLKFSSLDLQVWNILLHLHGASEWRAPYKSEFHMELPAVKLAGLGQILRPLTAGRRPIEGLLELKADFAGPLQRPALGRIALESAQLKDFSAEVNTAGTSAFEMRGPLRLNLMAKGVWDAGQFHSFVSSGELSTQGAGMVLGPLRKDPTQDLALKWAAKAEGAAFEITQVDLSGLLGHWQARGVIKNPLVPELSGFELRFAPLNLDQLRLALPEYHDFIPPGTLTADLHLNGNLITAEPWLSWPIATTGTLQAHLTEFTWITPPLPQTDVAGAVPVRPPLLPAGNLIARMKLQSVAVDMKKFTRDGLVMEGVQLNGKVSEGHFEGDLKLGHVFGGTMAFTDLDVPLQDHRARVEGDLKWQQIDVPAALTRLRRGLRQMADGRAQGRAHFNSALPSAVDFTSTMRARGEGEVQSLTLNSVRLGALFNDLNRNIPADLKDKLPAVEVSEEPLHGRARASFEITEGALRFDELTLHDVNGDEVQLAGLLAVDEGKIDLAGTYLWASPKVPRCWFEDASDAQGRMLIPVAVKGQLMQPEFSILPDFLPKIGNHAMKCVAADLALKKPDELPKADAAVKSTGPLPAAEGKQGK